MRGDAPEDRRRPPTNPVDEDSRPEERESFRAGLDLDRAWRDLCQLRDDGLLEPVDLGVGGEGIDSPEQARALAREVRGFLGVGDDPLGAMADVAAGLGLWCRTTTARIDGLSLTPQPGLGVAVIGEALEPCRRRATAAHEIGHHVAGDAYEASGHYAAPREAGGGKDRRLRRRAASPPDRRGTALEEGLRAPACPAHGSWPAPGPGTSGW